MSEINRKELQRVLIAGQANHDQGRKTIQDGVEESGPMVARMVQDVLRSWIEDQGKMRRDVQTLPDEVIKNIATMALFTLTESAVAIVQRRLDDGEPLWSDDE